MENENKNVFTMVNDRGESIDCEVILTIESDEYGKNYIVYTDHTTDKAGNINTYASTYDPTGKSMDLNPVESEEEWDMIENVLASAQREVLNKNGEN